MFVQQRIIRSHKTYKLAHESQTRQNDYPNFVRILTVGVSKYHMIVNKYVVLQNDMGVLLPQQLIGKVCNLHLCFVVIIAFHQVLEWVCSSGYIDIAVLRS